MNPAQNSQQMPSAEAVQYAMKLAQSLGVQILPRS